jgi:uncharacterized protein YxeA
VPRVYAVGVAAQLAVRNLVFAMKIALLILVGLAILIGIAVFLVVPKTQRIYALASRKVEFTFVVVNDERKEPIPGATIDIWNDLPKPKDRQRIAQVVTNDKGIATYVHPNQLVEDVVGISANHKLEGVRQHPASVGTFVDRFWCTLDVAAKGYVPLQSESLASYEYDDNGYDKQGKFHRVQFTFTLHRKKQ